MAEIKEFAEEVEPKVRRCLFCKAEAPAHLSGRDMTGGRGRWYSNALLSLRTREVVRFYVCPEHLSRTREAWEWAREGFIEEEIAELKGMEAVRVWLNGHPDLAKFAKKYV